MPLACPMNFVVTSVECSVFENWIYVYSVTIVHISLTAKSPAVCFLPCLSAVRCLALSSQRSAISRYFCQKHALEKKICWGFFSSWNFLFQFSKEQGCYLLVLVHSIPLPSLAAHRLSPSTHVGVFFDERVFIKHIKNSVRNSVSDHLFH